MRLFLVMVCAAALAHARPVSKGAIKLVYPHTVRRELPASDPVGVDAVSASSALSFEIASLNNETNQTGVPEIMPLLLKAADAPLLPAEVALTEQTATPEQVPAEAQAEVQDGVTQEGPAAPSPEAQVGNTQEAPVEPNQGARAETTPEAQAIATPEPSPAMYLAEDISVIPPSDHVEANDQSSPIEEKHISEGEASNATEPAEKTESWVSETGVAALKEDGAFQLRAADMQCTVIPGESPSGISSLQMGWILSCYDIPRATIDAVTFVEENDCRIVGGVRECTTFLPV